MWYFEKNKFQNDYVRWEEFFNTKGKIPIKFTPEILDSIDAIVSTFMHELHEIAGIRFAFSKKAGIRYERIHRLLQPGAQAGNLHDQALRLEREYASKIGASD